MCHPDRLNASEGVEGSLNADELSGLRDSSTRLHSLGTTQTTIKISAFAGMTRKENMRKEGSKFLSNFPLDNDPIPGEPSQLTQLRQIYDVVMRKVNKTSPPEELTLFSALEEAIKDAEQDLEFNPTLSSQTGEEVHRLLEENKHLIQP